MIREHAILAMSALRLFSGLLEVCAGLLILRLNRVDFALRVNGMMAIIGPTVLLLGIIIGISGLAGRLPLQKLLLIYLGGFLIFWGTRR